MVLLNSFVCKNLYTLVINHNCFIQSFDKQKVSFCKLIKLFVRIYYGLNVIIWP